MSKTISYEDYLKEYGSLTYTNVGVSMLPLLKQGRDLFTVEKKSDKRCKKGDVVLYHRPPDQYVLHRVIDVLPDSYVILGDNCIAREYGITDADILGVMISFVRKGRSFSIQDRRYRIYSALILHTIPFRIFCKKSAIRIKHSLKRIPRKTEQ